LEDDSTGIDIYLGLEADSFVLRSQGDQARGVVRWTITVEQEGGAPITLSPSDTLDGSRDRVWRVERVAVPAGDYMVRAVAEDRASDRTAERNATVSVSRPSRSASLSSLRLDRLEDGQSVPIDAGSVPAGLDSLRVVVQALSAPDGARTAVSVVRVQSDTLAALPIVGQTPGQGALRARGIDLAHVDTVQVVRQDVLNPASALDVTAPLPRLRPGVYRVEVAMLSPDGDRLALEDRLFVVRRRDYPAVTRLGDLVGPLTYLAEDRALREIRDAMTDTARRRAFDRFWGERMADRRLASATIRAFYERVEEANRLFGVHKEGWKTDPGMAYVLFGPPTFVDQTMRGERWTYIQSGATPPVLEFERTAGVAGDGVPFRILTLQRDRAYADVWRQARQLWRSGAVPGGRG
ncbi:GWxTD domain-containing protein, partial [Rubrivirga sp.]|uniref:GWxTD domain-containing protein n=1 Tax=Rubrivirga sp. TaxID=1885344 RepID=UPI003C775131